MTEYERKLLGNMFRKKFKPSGSKTNKQKEELKVSPRQKKGGQTNADI